MYSHCMSSSNAAVSSGMKGVQRLRATRLLDFVHLLSASVQCVGGRGQVLPDGRESTAYKHRAALSCVL